MKKYKKIVFSGSAGQIFLKFFLSLEDTILDVAAKFKRNNTTEFYLRKEKEQKPKNCIFGGYVSSTLPKLGVP